MTAAILAAHSIEERTERQSQGNERSRQAGTQTGAPPRPAVPGKASRPACVPPRRFTVDGSDELEIALEQTCERVRAGVADLIPARRFEGLLLAGGYGRGEGGVLRTPEGDRPYNDLEFYVFVRGNRLLAERRYREPLHELGERLSSSAGLEVEFKVLTAAHLRHSPVSMFYYDLVSGHQRLAGGEELLRGCEHHRTALRIPLHEATRLLLNRCSGLLFARARLVRTGDFTAADADFVGRNLAKAKLAFGDVLLAAKGQYQWSCRERHWRLRGWQLTEDLAWAAPLVDLHGEGVDFKLHPVRSPASRDTLEAEHARLSHLGRRLWLWLEGRRLGPHFASARDYALSAVNKCPECPALRNRLINARTFGLAAAIGRAGRRYPRERLLQALPLLLWETDGLEDAGLRECIQTALDTRAVGFEAVVQAYRQLWERFN